MELGLFWILGNQKTPPQQQQSPVALLALLDDFSCTFFQGMNLRTVEVLKCSLENTVKVTKDGCFFPFRGKYQKKIVQKVLSRYLGEVVNSEIHLLHFVT